MLLLCYNRPLGESFSEAFKGDDRVTAGSFHRWGRDLLESAGLLPGGTLPNQFFQETMPELIPDAADRLDRRWDALVIDEGQDFSPAWFTALLLSLDDPDHDVARFGIRGGRTIVGYGANSGPDRSTGHQRRGCPAGDGR